MKRHLASLVTGLLLVSAGAGLYTAPAYAAEKTQARDPQQIYGHELMTEQERAEHRQRMNSFKTEQEREQFRQKHHKKMWERAEERGVTLPEEPMTRGKGMHKGGMGGGHP